MKIQIIILCSLAVVLATGCISPKLQPKPEIGGIHRTDRKHLENPKTPIVLPFNYTQNTDWRKQVMLSDFSKPVQISPGSQQFTAQTMRDPSVFLQAKMGYIKRFEIWAMRNDGTFVLAKELEDIGEGSIKTQKEIEWDIFQSGTITMAKGFHQLRNGQAHVEYVVTVIVEIKDQNRSVKGRTLTYKGHSFRNGFVSHKTGKITAGYTGRQEDEAIEEACMHALKQYMGGIANEFPVTGNITDITSTRMAMDKGLEQGLGQKSQMCIWGKIGTIGVPLAYAEALPGEDESTLTVYRWNEKDPDAAPIIKAMRETPNWLLQPGNKLFATSVGMPFPPEWGGE